MKRRDSILAMLAMAAASGPFPIRAQQPVHRPYRIALVPDFSSDWEVGLLKPFVEALRESGRIEGRDYVIYRSGAFYNSDTTLPVERALEANPDLFVAINLGYAVELHKRTKSIPIVMGISGFPVEGGVAASLARPGKNVTGMTIYAGGEVFGKLVGLVHEAKPKAKRIGALMSYVPPFHTPAEADLIRTGMGDAARSLGLDLRIFDIARSEQVDEALASAAAQRVDALILTSGASIFPHRRKITQFALAKRLPTITEGDWSNIEPAPLLAYRALFGPLMRQAATYVIRILWEGAKPGDLPIQLPAKFEFSVNLKTAKAIGLTVPKALLIRADKVLE